MVHKASAHRGYTLFFAATSFIIFFGFLLPSQTSAAEISVQTAQLLPPGTPNTCVQLPVSGFTPYVYDDALHAFEFSVPDNSYVAIAGMVGSSNIPFNHLIRTTDASGNLRVHADIDTTPIHGNLSVSVIMLSAKGPTQPVCVSIILTAIETEEGIQTAPSPTPIAPKPSTGGQTNVTPVKPAPTTATSSGNTNVEPQIPSATSSTSSTQATSTGVSPIATFQSTLKAMCGGEGALRLWGALLVIYILIVLAAVFGQSKLPLAFRTQEWAAVAIVVPFLLLFGFWYFVEACRTSAWIPVAATVIALAGLSAAFWERKGSVNVINLPSAKK